MISSANPSRQLVALVAGWTGNHRGSGYSRQDGHPSGHDAGEGGKPFGRGDRRDRGFPIFRPLATEGIWSPLGIRTHVADLLDPRAYDALPDADRVVFMAGRKFGTGGSEGLTWATNTLIPQADLPPIRRSSDCRLFHRCGLRPGAGRTAAGPLKPRL